MCLDITVSLWFNEDSINQLFWCYPWVRIFLIQKYWKLIHVPLRTSPSEEWINDRADDERIHVWLQQTHFLITALRLLSPWWRRQMKHFPRYWPSVQGIHRSPMNSPHTGQWRGALIFSLICAWINGWINNREACDLRRHRAHYAVVVKPEHFLASFSW